MADILLFSDVHVHSHKNSLQRLEDCLAVLRWVFKVAREKQVEHIVFCGDLFQNRLKIDTLAYCKTYEIFEDNKDIPVVLLEGNHDLWFHERLDVSSVKPFGALPNVTVIAEPKSAVVADLLIDFLPFTHNPIQVIQEKFRKKNRVLCGHISVHGAQLNKLYNTKADVSIEIEKDMIPVDITMFHGWERVFLGHFHGEQKLNDRVEYLGSPLQLNFNEAFQKKHIAIMNTETLEVRYVENTFSPRHLIVPFSKINEYDLANNFVQIELDNESEIDIVEVRNELVEKHKVQTLEFKDAKERAEAINREELQDKFNLTKGDVLERYIQAIGIGDLQKDMLVQIGQEICRSDV